MSRKTRHASNYKVLKEMILKILSSSLFFVLFFVDDEMKMFDRSEKMRETLNPFLL